MSSSRVQTTLTGPSTCLRDAHGLGHVVDLEPATEAAAEQMVVDHDLLQREAGDLGRGRLRAAQHLRAGPHLAAVLPHVDRAVHRLHRGVREERRLVHRFDLLAAPASAARGVALASARRTPGSRDAASSPCDDVGGAQLAVRPVVPADGERRQPLLRRPHVVGRPPRPRRRAARPGARPGSPSPCCRRGWQPCRRPPGSRQRVAIFIPGSRTSMPNFAVPFTLLGVSSRLAGVPISVKSFGSLSATSAGTGSFAASLGQRAVGERPAGRRVGDHALLRPARRRVDAPASAPPRRRACCARPRPRWRSGS